MLGISIYPDKVENINEIYDYIDLAHKYGFKKLFTCLLSNNELDFEQLKEKFKFVEYAKKLGFETIFDINPRVLKELNISYHDSHYFKELHSTILRLDLGFDGKTEADITYNKDNLKVEINMANDTNYIDLIMDYVPKRNFIQGSFNFYPQKNSALSYDFFEKCSQRFKKYNLNTTAFIGVAEALDGPWELNENAVTIEMHRKLSPITQVKHLYVSELIDDIIISTQFASEEALKQISEIDDSILQLSLENITENTLENKILFEEEHFRRGDSNLYTIRSTQSRVKFKNENFEPNITPTSLKRGMVVIGNNDFGQYKGELQIILNDFEDLSNNKNLVGTIKEEELFLLDYIKPWQRFKFTKA